MSGIKVPDIYPVYYRPTALEGIQWDGERDSAYAIMAWLTQHAQTPSIEKEFPNFHIVWKDLYTNESMKLNAEDWLLIDPTNNVTYVRNTKDADKFLLFMADMSPAELDVFYKLKKGAEDA